MLPAITVSNGHMILCKQQIEQSAGYYCRVASNKELLTRNLDHTLKMQTVFSCVSQNISKSSFVKYHLLLAL